MSTLSIGDEVKYFEWNGTGHDSFPALVRGFNGGDPAGHPTIDLYYQDGGTTFSVQNKQNIEELASLDNNDYWKRNIVQPDLFDSEPFETGTPSAAGLVWYFDGPNAEGDWIHHMAIIQAVVGGTSGKVVNLFWVNPTNGVRNNENQVEGYEDADRDAESYWCIRRLAPGDEG